MASRRNVKYIEQDEPSFLKKFKERVAYKEPTNINDKFSEETDSSKDESNQNEREIEDEQPVIVVLKQGDLSAEEVAKLKKENESTGRLCCQIWRNLSFVCYVEVHLALFCGAHKSFHNK